MNMSEMPASERLSLCGACSPVIMFVWERARYAQPLRLLSTPTTNKEENTPMPYTAVK